MRKLLLTLLVLLSLLVVSALAALCIGEISFSPGELLALRDAPEDDIRLNILMQLRVPRILLGLIAGGALSLAGVILQGIFLEPYTLGISGGASVGVTLAILLGLHTAYGGLALSLAGFLGALATIFVVYGLGIRRGQVRIQTLLLTGVMISFISSSLMLLMMSLSKTEDLPGIVFWIMGSLAETDGALITLLCITSFLVLLLSFLYAPQLNAMRLGSERAMQLGVDTDRVIKLLFVFSSLLTGICVSIVGVIGFVGLIVPQLMRALLGTDNRILLPASFFGGGIFLIISDIVARTIISPNELPIGVITGIIGGSVFILVMAKGKEIRN